MNTDQAQPKLSLFKKINFFIITLFSMLFFLTSMMCVQNAGDERMGFGAACVGTSADLCAARMVDGPRWRPSHSLCYFLCTGMSV